MQNNNDFSCVCAPYCSSAPVLASQPKLEAQKAVFCWRTFHIYCCIFCTFSLFLPHWISQFPSHCVLLLAAAYSHHWPGEDVNNISLLVHMRLASRFGEKLHQEIIACMEGSLSRRTPHKALNQPHRRHQTLFMGCKLTFFPQLFRSLHTFDAKSFRSFT